jgi:hypothetical protein
MKDKLIVAYVCDKRYLPFMKLSMSSVRRYNKNVEFAVLTKEDLKIEGARVFKISVDTSHLDLKFRKNDRMKEHVYFKFFLPMLPYDKILFLDCDVLCQRPLDSLWNTPCQFICATESYKIGKKQAQELGLKKYALTGMMLMNLKELRNQDFTNRCFRRLHSEKIVNAHDETIINLEFNDKITFIDRKYNYCRNRSYETPLCEHDVYLLHFVGKEYDKNEMLKYESFTSLNKLKDLLKDKSVAIVGNSEKILSQSFGDEIDSHDIVIRFNKGIPRNKIAQGTKTTLLFLACTLTKEELKEYSPLYTIRRSKLSENKCDFQLSSTERLQFIQEANKVRRGMKKATSQASTGFIAIQFVLSTQYKKLDLYGFDFFKSPTYYNEPGYKTLHNGDKEADKVFEYQEVGLLTIRNP